jgi:hypothetical protein
MSLRLHEIISILADDKNLFLVRQESKEKDIRTNNIDYGFRAVCMGPLNMYQKQKTDYFPSHMRKFIPKSAYRFGIQQMDPGNEKINISFLNCINCFLIDSVKTSAPSVQLKNVKELRSVLLRCMPHSRKRNNVRSRIEHNVTDKEIIQQICNLFQINLLLLDLSDEQTIFFYCYLEQKQLHFYRPLYYVSKVNNYYEPIFVTGKQDINSRYLLILNNWNELETDNDFSVNACYFEYLNRIGITNEMYHYFAQKEEHKRNKEKKQQETNDNRAAKKNNTRATGSKNRN